LTAGGSRARRRRATPLLAVLAAALLLVLMAPPSAAQDGGDQGAGSPSQNCELDPDDPLCAITTTTTEATTTTAKATTTTARATSTTQRATTTTVVDIVEDVTTTTLPVTTSANLLVPGDGTEGAESTTTTEPVLAASSSDGLSDGTLIGLVVAGLVLIAVVIGILTWRYWVATRPAPQEGDRTPAAAG